jgi:hypothetical protein
MPVLTRNPSSTGLPKAHSTPSWLHVQDVIPVRSVNQCQGEFDEFRRATLSVCRQVNDNRRPGVTPPGNADGCENKGVAEKAIRKNMKTKGLQIDGTARGICKTMKTNGATGGHRERDPVQQRPLPRKSRSDVGGMGELTGRKSANGMPQGLGDDDHGLFY